MSLEAGRAALRERQGAGARFDAEAAPHLNLLAARRATAYFARVLGNLSNQDLERHFDERIRKRRLIVSFTGHQARCLAEAVASVRGMAPSEERGPLRLEPTSNEVELGATLPADALRHLVKHAAIHLDVEWRDSTDAHWSQMVTDDEGRSVTMRDLPLVRAGVLWRSALHLDAGGRFADVPQQFREKVDSTLEDVSLPVRSGGYPSALTGMATRKVL